MLVRTPGNTAPKRERTPDALSAQADPFVTLTLKLPHHSAPALCQAVAQALRRDVDVYMTRSDRLTGHATLQFLLHVHEPDKVMKIAMLTVACAEFGYVQHLAATAVH